MLVAVKGEYIAHELLFFLTYIDSLDTRYSHVAIDEYDTSCSLLAEELCVLKIYARRYEEMHELVCIQHFQLFECQ